MEEKKMCCTCKYFSNSYLEEPCKSCSRGEDRSNWVDKSKPDKFKVGDLVVMKNDIGVKNIYIYLGDDWALRVPKTLEKKPVTKITVHHMGEARYDKYPTLNANFIKRVIFSDPATIVFWEDGTKTVVKTQDGEKYDKEKGLAMAISKRVFGNERDYYNVFKRWMRKGEERHEET